MKKQFLIILTMALLSTGMMAQQPSGTHKKHPRVEDIVSDLSATQKRRLNTINEESKKRIDALKVQQQQLRDSIRGIIESEGDNSQRVFPLFDREGELQASISKEIYTTRIRIDEILTPEQREQVHKVFAEECNKDKNKPRKATAKE